MFLANHPHEDTLVERRWQAPSNQVDDTRGEKSSHSAGSSFEASMSAAGKEASAAPGTDVARRRDAAAAAPMYRRATYSGFQPTVAIIWTVSSPAISVPPQPLPERNAKWNCSHSDLLNRPVYASAPSSLSAIASESLVSAISPVV